MKSYHRLMFLIIILFTAGIVLANLSFSWNEDQGSKLYNIEANRLMDVLSAEGSLTDNNISVCAYITDFRFLPKEASSSDQESFFDGGGYIIRPVYDDGELSGYIKFIISEEDNGRSGFLRWQNSVLAVIFIMVAVILIYIKKEIVHPMNVFKALPAALSKGDFTMSVKAEKGRFFGEFLWGLDRLRESMLMERRKNYSLEKEKNRTVLALAHDIKTPLGAIILCSKALREGLYPEKEKQNELLVKIDERAMDIQALIQKLQEGASEEMLDLPVEDGVFYLDEMIKRVEEAYGWQTSLAGTEFIVKPYSNCMLKGDGERAFEAMCNLLENAMKYGDGKSISIGFFQEEGCQLIVVANSGNDLLQEEWVHLFDSFWRGSNARGKPGNGLGLFIARRLCVKMGGETFVEVNEDEVRIILVFRIA